MKNKKKTEEEGICIIYKHANIISFRQHTRIPVIIWRKIRWNLSSVKRKSDPDTHTHIGIYIEILTRI